MFNTGVDLGKIRNKNHDEVRYYKGVIRDLQKQIRQLQRQLKYHDKRQHIVDENKEELIELLKQKEDVPEIKKKIACVNCVEGYYDEFMLLDRLYGTCNHCGTRKRLV